MFDLLNNPIFTFLAGIVVSIILGIVFYNLQIKRKPKPEWGIYSSSPVLIGDNTVNSLLKITYKNIELDTLTVTSMYLKNKGKISLRKSDIVEPVKFILKNNAEIIDVIDIKSSNKSFSVNIKSDSDEFGETYDFIEVTFDYMNPNQDVSFTLLHTGYDDNCIVAEAELLDTELSKAQKYNPNYRYVTETIMKVLLSRYF